MKGIRFSHRARPLVATLALLAPLAPEAPTAPGPPADGKAKVTAKYFINVSSEPLALR